MLYLDKTRFQEALKRRGYPSLDALAKSLGLHRNTLRHYLAGQSVIPSGLERIIAGLGLKPGDLLVEKMDPDFPDETVASVVDDLHEKFPNVSFILFGSRVGGRARRYSDWDVGAFSAAGLPHEVFRRILRRKDERVENLPVLIDLVNLNRAEGYFLKEISRSWRFLAGRQKDWIALQKRALDEKKERH